MRTNTKVPSGLTEDARNIVIASAIETLGTNATANEARRICQTVARYAIEATYLTPAELVEVNALTDAVRHHPDIFLSAQEETVGACPLMLRLTEGEEEPKTQRMWAPPSEALKFVPVPKTERLLGARAGKMTHQVEIADSVFERTVLRFLTKLLSFFCDVTISENDDVEPVTVRRFA